MELLNIIAFCFVDIFFCFGVIFEVATAIFLILVILSKIFY